MMTVKVAVFTNEKTNEIKKFATGDFTHVMPDGFKFDRYETIDISDALYQWLYKEDKNNDY